MTDAHTRPACRTPRRSRAGDWVVVSGQLGLVDGALVERHRRRGSTRRSPTSPTGWPSTASPWSTS